MINQKLISLKIHYATLEALDKECLNYGGKRNRRINTAIRMYLKLRDVRRLLKSLGSARDKEQVLQEWLREWIPEAATW